MLGTGCASVGVNNYVRRFFVNDFVKCRAIWRRTVTPFSERQSSGGLWEEARTLAALAFTLDNVREKRRLDIERTQPERANGTREKRVMPVLLVVLSFFVFFSSFY